MPKDYYGELPPTTKLQYRYERGCISYYAPLPRPHHLAELLFRRGVVLNVITHRSRSLFRGRTINLYNTFRPNDVLTTNNRIFNGRLAVRRGKSNNLYPLCPYPGINRNDQFLFQARDRQRATINLRSHVKSVPKIRRVFTTRHLRRVNNDRPRNTRDILVSLAIRSGNFKPPKRRIRGTLTPRTRSQSRRLRHHGRGREGRTNYSQCFFEFGKSKDGVKSRSNKCRFLELRFPRLAFTRRPRNGRSTRVSRSNARSRRFRAKAPPDMWPPPQQADCRGKNNGVRRLSDRLTTGLTRLGTEFNQSTSFCTGRLRLCRYGKTVILFSKVTDLGKL